MRKILFTLLALMTTVAIEAQDLTGSWTGKLNVGGMSLNLVLNFKKDTNGKLSCTLDSPDQGAKDIPTELVSGDPKNLKVSVAAIGMTYEGSLTGEELKGTFSQNGFTAPLNLKRGKVEMRRPQEPKPPFPYTTEEVTFSNPEAKAVLSGTLAYPTGYDKKKPVPVVLLVSGSGLQNRDEELLGHKPMLVIADYLARHGIASLRYDDRGSYKSTGDASQATTKDFMDDAACGIGWLRGQGKKFSRVGVIGHSEGGMIAFMLAARGKADFIVSLAGPGAKGDTILAGQMNLQLKMSGSPKRMTTADVRKQFAASDKAWFKYFMDYDPREDIAAAKCPVMAVNGTKDTQVVPELNFTVIEQALPKNPKNLLKKYDGLNHLFQHCTTGYGNEYGQIEETISPEVLGDMAGWIKSIL